MGRTQKPDEKPREQYLREELRSVQSDIAWCRAKEKMREMAPLLVYARKVRDMLDAELARLEAAADNGEGDITPEELEAGMVEDLLSIPADMRRRILDQVQGVRVLREA
jgi:chorismate synthase